MQTDFLILYPTGLWNFLGIATLEKAIEECEKKRIHSPQCCLYQRFDRHPVDKAENRFQFEDGNKHDLLITYPGGSFQGFGVDSEDAARGIWAQRRVANPQCEAWVRVDIAKEGTNV